MKNVGTRQKQNFTIQIIKNPLKYLIFAILVICIFTNVGCSNRTITLHPIEKADIFVIPKGAEVKYPSGDKDVVEKDGYFLSEFYIEEVAEAKVE